jgi:DNA polymerase
MRDELRRIAAELRARAELSDAEDWKTDGAGAEAAVPTLGTAAPSESPREAEVSAAGTEHSPAAVTTLDSLREAVLACRDCPLGEQRINPAFGVGSSDAEVMFIGEGPGFEEDRQGEPFVGKAGQLLDNILKSVALSRKSVYIANIVKCHPMKDPEHPDRRGNDRPPTPSEIEACRHYLDEQIRLIRPRFLVALGGVAAKVMIGTETGIMKLRGRWHEYNPGEIPLLPTFHPAFLLRSPEHKRDVWEDMKDLRRRLDAEEI